ncbi:MAG: MAPEG family protein [Deltaproteobacteria bacterium]|nr:MAPEG family protein [Deltaproteobacteria bacterium]MBI3391533.1 MAPEG family protein [Deltaproteobacteria bacterium]
MSVAIVCTALLGLLVFALGFAVSATRGSTGTNFGYKPDPADRLYKLVRAHGNATEYCPMMAILILLIGAHQPSTWMIWTFVAATALRYCHAAGMILSPTLDKPYPLRFVGALGTYLAGFALVVAALMA